MVNVKQFLISFIIFVILVEKFTAEKRDLPKSPSKETAEERELRSKQTQDEQTFRFKLRGGPFECTIDGTQYCDERSGLLIQVEIMGFYNYDTERKVTTISVGHGSMPGPGWFFRKYPLESGTKIGPIVWEYMLNISFDNEPGVRVVNYKPHKDTIDNEFSVRYSEEYTTGQRWKVGVEGEVSFSDKSSYYPVPGVGASYEQEWVAKRNIKTSYINKATEYVIASAGVDNFAFTKYSRSHLTHSDYMELNRPLCQKYWAINKLGPAAYAGFVPGFFVAIEGEMSYGKRQTVSFSAEAKIAQMNLKTKGKGCDQTLTYEQERTKDIQINKTIKINWGHPLFTLFRPVLIRMKNYVPENAKMLCLQAFPEGKPDKFVFLADCEQLNGKYSRAWYPDPKSRYHWYSDQLDSDFCLSSDLRRTMNLLVEKCSADRTQQVWKFQDGVFSNSDGHLYIAKDTDAPVILDENVPRVKWEFISIPTLDTKEAFDLT